MQEFNINSSIGWDPDLAQNQCTLNFSSQVLGPWSWHTWQRWLVILPQVLGSPVSLVGCTIKNVIIMAMIILIIIIINFNYGYHHCCQYHCMAIIITSLLLTLLLFGGAPLQ